MGSSGASTSKIDDASNGAGTTQLFIGTYTIDVTATSDEVTKKDIVINKRGLDEILRLEVKEFKFKTEYVDDGGKTHTAFVAQDVQNVIPEAVFTRSDGLIAVDMRKMIPFLVNAIQAQQLMIEDLSARLKTLEAK